MLAQYKALALAGLVSLGCEPRQQEAGRSDEVRLWYFPGLATHPDETIEGAEEILGMDLQLGTEAPRSIAVFYLPDLPIDGESGSAHPCGRAIWAGNDSNVLAHELGHALSLQHYDEDGVEYPETNLMGPGRGTDLTEEQIDTMRWAAWWLENKCAPP